MDVYVQVAYLQLSLRGDPLLKCKHTLVDCHAMLTDEVANIIIPHYIISGSGHTSRFCGHGKKKLLARVAKDPQTPELL